MSPPPAKRQKRHHHHDKSKRLSEEALLVVFSLLDCKDLVRAQLVCTRWRRIANDQQIWRKLYKRHFLVPRARPPSWSLNDDDDNDNARNNNGTKDWRQRYKLESNWVRGLCQIKPCEIGPGTCPPPIIQCNLPSRLLMAADMSRISLWSLEDPTAGVLASASHYKSQPPSCMQFAHSTTDSDQIVFLGFPDGTLASWYSKQDNTKLVPGPHISVGSGSICGLAVHMPLVAAVNVQGQLGLFRITTKDRNAALARVLSLDSPFQNDASSLLRVFMRKLRSQNLISILIVHISAQEYNDLSSFSTLQELLLDADTLRLVKNRTAIGQDNTNQPGGLYQNIMASKRRRISSHGGSSSSSSTSTISIAYSHPYLLVSSSPYSLKSKSLATMTAYLVKSTPSSLGLSRGLQLCKSSSLIKTPHTVEVLAETGRIVSFSDSCNALIWDAQLIGALVSRSSSFYNRREQQQQSRLISSSPPTPVGHTSSSFAFTKFLTDFGIGTPDWLFGDGAKGIAVRPINGCRPLMDTDNIKCKIPSSTYLGFDSELLVIQRPNEAQVVDIYDFR